MPTAAHAIRQLLEGTGTLQAWGGGPETPVQFYFDVTRTELERHPVLPTQMRTNAVGKVWAAGVSFPDGLYRLKTTPGGGTAEYQLQKRSDEWRMVLLMPYLAGGLLGSQ